MTNLRYRLRSGPVRAFTVGLALGLVVSISGCSAFEAEEPITNPTSTTPQDVHSTPGAETTEDAPAEVRLPVYWIGENEGKRYLYREFRMLRADNDAVSAAVEAMTDSSPLDPQFSTPWRPASKVGSAMGARNVVTVDISSDAFGEEPDREQAELAIQQLVYTAAAAAAKAELVPADGSAKVIILVDGHTGYNAFGQIPLGDVMERDPTKPAPVWVIEPQQDAVVPGPTTKIEGRVLTNVSRLNYEIETADGEIVESGDVPLPPTGLNGVKVYSFEKELEPGGNYTLRVFEPGPDGAQQFVDDKNFTVR